MSQQISSSLEATFPLVEQPTLRSMWGYIRHELIYVTWATMEAALITPIALSLMLWANEWPGELVLLWLILLILLPLNVVRVFSILQISLSRQRQLLIGIGIFLALFTLYMVIYRQQTSFLGGQWLVIFVRNLITSNNNAWVPDVSILVLIVVAWWRGLMLISRQPAVIYIGQIMRRGGFIIAPLTIWMATRIDWNTMPYLMLFFGAALMAITLVRIEEVERDNEITITAVTPRWVAIVTGIAAFIVILAGSFAIFTSRRPDLINGWIAPFWLAIRFTLVPFFTLLKVYLLQPLIPYFEAFAQWLGQFINPLFGMVNDGLPPGDTTATNPMLELVEELQSQREPIQWILTDQLLLVIALLVFFVLITRYLGHIRRQYQGDTAAVFLQDATASTLPVPRRPNWRERLKHRWQQLRQRGMILSIRRIYRQMCTLAEECGYPRPPTVTPYEYLSSLNKLWPDNEADTRLITKAYVKIRYGELPESKAELQTLQDTWERLRQTPGSSVS